jgi:hypothetical protein
MHPVNLDKHLEELVLGHLSEGERAGLEEHLATCAECARRRDELEALCAELALALPPAPPLPSLRTRLFSSVEHLERFAPMAPRLAELLDILPNEARRSLHAFERPEALPSVVPGMRATRLTPGPRRQATEAILAWLDPGTGLPRHKHRGEGVPGDLAPGTHLCAIPWLGAHVDGDASAEPCAGSDPILGPAAAGDSGREPGRGGRRARWASFGKIPTREPAGAHAPCAPAEGSGLHSSARYISTPVSAPATGVKPSRA